MAVKIFDTTLAAATIQGLTASHYYWIDRGGNAIDVGGSALVATAAVPIPNDQSLFDLSMFQFVEMFASHGALTSGVGGKISAAQVVPDLVQFATAPIVVGTGTIDQALAATAESTATTLVNPPNSARASKIALAILWTTVPTAGTGMRISVWGHRDGQDRARG